MDFGDGQEIRRFWFFLGVNRLVETTLQRLSKLQFNGVFGNSGLVARPADGWPVDGLAWAALLNREQNTELLEAGCYGVELDTEALGAGISLNRDIDVLTESHSDS